MSYNSVYYWKNFLDKNQPTVAKADSFIINFYVMNKKAQQHYCKWFFFDSHEELLGFVKYVVLPSMYYSRLYGTIGEAVLIQSDTYEGVLDIVDENPINDETLLYYMEQDFKEIERLEKDYTLIMLKILCYNLTFHVNFWGDVFSGITIFENFKELHERLVKAFGKYDAGELWEEQLEMSQEEILGVFSNIDSNPFMLRQIGGLLNRSGVII